jgi:folate-binding protein YgfZ
MDIEKQIEAARGAALAVPRDDLATLAVTGSDRLSWLNGLLTCDLAKRPAAAAVYGLAVARNGRVLSDAIVVVDDASARVLVGVPRASAEALRAHFDHYLVMEDVEMAPRTDAFQGWAVHGPKAEGALAAAVAAGAVGGSLDFTGLGGAFVLAPDSAIAAVRSALEAAAAVGDEGGWEALRLERAVPRFGVDFDDKTYPQEAALEKAAVSFNKGCYLGQEVVCMLEMRGHVKRKLVLLVVEPSAGQSLPARGATVTDESGAPVGEVTSSAQSVTLGRPVALAMVKRAAGEPGKRLCISGAPAEVVEGPARG